MPDQYNADSEAARVVAAWGRVEAWLRTHAPVSAKTILPPADARVLADAEVQLRAAHGHGFPEELTALWHLCGGVGWVDFGEDEGGVMAAYEFLDSVLLGPGEAVWARGAWEGMAGSPSGVPRPVTDWVPWLGPDNDAPDNGRYASSSGVGRWAFHEGAELDAPTGFPSVAAYVEAVADAFEHGTGPLVSRPAPDRHVPGVVGGALIWARLDRPHGVPDGWEPIHPLP
ncbi:SMI1/KNR4 family protein [Streptomyces litchfieldiae]|uniref:Knr4/Smi1-like domain-containing protein n=1 Tax=Streptomyces litchfieldiae TaxID=3075543 RepID=A0ABU2MZ93_9ACTN|nr:hypothetical protein [Streptomyces sp. DSM 44938]MDT0346939.1 hypothetical protein [Streptomyces sp. DSM 44938]